MIAELSIVPSGGGESLSADVAEACRILVATGLPCEGMPWGRAS
ncbi:MAG: hypothetical protein NTX23_00980 [Candidatus Bipolaricaulota bacterium]|nr:hypothetical protein [Candidatus Bipolaricaulota bacterium]